MNVFTFTGNLGRDAEKKDINGTALLSFAVGVKAGFGQSEQTLWMDCSLWGKQAESRLVDHIVKGQRVSVSGELGTREYQANDGTTKTVITCRVNQIGLEGSAPAQTGQQQAPRQRSQQAPAQAPHQQRQQQALLQQAPQSVNDDFDDDMPFN